MALQNYEYRYELKPGRFVYIQRPWSNIRGRAIIKQVLKRYTPHPIFYHLERRGGHVAALRLHQQSSYFSRFDITNFFGQVSRTRISRTLREIGFRRSKAFNMAIESVVVEGPDKVLPYGFCQSPVLATLALEYSYLGTELKKLYNNNILVSVYVDDILVSSDDKAALEVASKAVVAAADIAGFPLSTEKVAFISSGVDAFNCHIEAAKLSILDNRMERFLRDHDQANDAGKQAIEKYIDAVSNDELDRFLKML